MTDPDREPHVVVHSERKSSGGAIAAIVIVLLALLVAFMLFGDQLGGGDATEATDVEVDVEAPEAPATTG